MGVLCGTVCEYGGVCDCVSVFVCLETSGCVYQLVVCLSVNPCMCVCQSHVSISMADCAHFVSDQFGSSAAQSQSSQEVQIPDPLPHMCTSKKANLDVHTSVALEQCRMHALPETPPQVMFLM